MRRATKHREAGETEAGVAYRRLRRAILRAELASGEALVEADLMARFDVGRTPLRDALHKLSHEGLVDILPRRGTFVSQVTLSDLQQIFEARAGIEELVARSAAAHVTPEQLERMRALLKRAATVEGPESDVDLDQDFHRLMLEIVGNRYLRDMYQRLADSSLRLLYITRCGMESPEEQRRTLVAAAAALERRDRAALTEVLIDHVKAFRDRVGASIFAGTLAAGA